MVGHAINSQQLRVVVLYDPADVSFYTFPYFARNLAFPVFNAKNVLDQYLGVGVRHLVKFRSHAA